MRILPIVIAAIAVAILYVAVLGRDSIETGSESEGAAGAQSESSPAVKVVAVRSTSRQIGSAVVVRGKTEADHQVLLRAETTGLVISPPLAKGASVKRGDAVCEIDPGTRASKLEQARALLVETEARETEAVAKRKEALALLESKRLDANALERLGDDGFATETSIAAARASAASAVAAVASAEAGVKAARANVVSRRTAVADAELEITRLSIRAPFDGILESDSAELGSLLRAGDPCATVIGLDPIVLVGFVPETEVSRIALGAPVQAELASGERVSGNVTFVSRSADVATRTFRIEVEVPNRDLSVRDGQTVEIAVAAEGSMAHLLPQSALSLNDAGALGVNAVENGDVKFIPVRLVRDTPEGVLVSGLPEQVDVIVVGQDFVVDGVRVEPTYLEQNQ